MRTTEQPEAIKLAKWLETIDDESWNSCWHSYTPQKAAAELRRLHAGNEALGGSAWLRKALDGKGKAINP